MSAPTSTPLNGRSGWPARFNTVFVGLAVVAFVGLAGQRLLAGLPGLSDPAPAPGQPGMVMDRFSTVDPGLVPGGEPSHEADPVPLTLEALVGGPVQFVAAGEGGAIVTVRDQRFRIGDVLLDGSVLVGIALDHVIVASAADQPRLVPVVLSGRNLDGEMQDR